MYTVSNCHERISPYSKPNQSVLFINIKLPYDGFLYMEEYCKGDKKTLRIEETSVTDEEVGTIVYSVCTEWSPHDVEVNYRFDEGRIIQNRPSSNL